MGCSQSVEAGAMGAEGRRASSYTYTAEAKDAAALVTGANNFTSKVRLRISCNNLVNADLLSKSDPFAVIWELQTDMRIPNVAGHWREVGRTEVVANSLDPEFVRDTTMLFNFEKRQKLKLEIYDADTAGDSSTLNLAQQDFLGQAEFMLPDIMTRGNPVATTALRAKNSEAIVKHRGAPSTATLRLEELTSVKSAVTFTASAAGLRRSTGAFLTISQSFEGGINSQASWSRVYKSEVARGTQDGLRWAPIEIPMLNLCNGDVNRPLKFEVWSWVNSGVHEFLGEFETSLRGMQDSNLDGGTMRVALAGSRKVGWSTQQGKGTLILDGVSVVDRPSFIEYIQKGCELNFMVAVDFTASNGAPSDPSSLHYHRAGVNTNPYIRAINGIGAVLEYYDADKKFPAYGFGARIGNNPVQHAFPLTPPGAPSADCAGVDGIIRAYTDSLTRWGLSGPTLFAPVIEEAASQASQLAPGEGFLCLLILTDGVIMDMPNTKRAIIAASRLPMCILIVGVGNANFDAMEELDSDDKVLQYAGQKAEHDIVQFVEFSKHAMDGESLAAELLAELPGQLLRHFRARGVLPGAFQHATAPPPPPYGVPAAYTGGGGAVGPPLPAGYGAPLPSAPVAMPPESNPVYGGVR